MASLSTDSQLDSLEYSETQENETSSIPVKIVLFQGEQITLPLSILEQGEIHYLWPNDFCLRRQEQEPDWKGFFRNLPERLATGDHETITKYLFMEEAVDRVQDEAVDFSCEVKKLKLEDVLEVFDGQLFVLTLGAKLDPGGNIREMIKTIIANRRAEEDQLDYVEEDNFRLTENEAEKYQIGDTGENKPCFYRHQTWLAEILVRRMELIFGNDQRLADRFDNFEFQIYTAKFKILEEQTIRRLADPVAKCFPRGLCDGPRQKLLQKAKVHVGKYSLGLEGWRRHLILQRRAKDEPRTLFLIVADEAHWGITKYTSIRGKRTAPDDDETRYDPGAHNVLVNSWNDTDHPNVMVLLVTATPENLLTENTPIDRASHCAVCVSGSQEGELRRVDVRQTGHRTLLSIHGKDATKEMGAPLKIHHVKWSEGHQRMFSKGIIMTLEVPLKLKDLGTQVNSALQWLHVPSPRPERAGNAVSWEGREECMATEVLIKGTNTVTISTTDGAQILTVYEDSHTTHAAFIKADHLKNFKNTCTEFYPMLDFGEDVFELKAHNLYHNQEVYLKYNHVSHKIVTGSKPAEASNSDQVPDLEYCFLIDTQRGLEEICPGKQYLSLNYYFNSMRKMNNSDRLIRADLGLIDLCAAAKQRKRALTDDDILTSEYSFYILLIQYLRKCTLKARSFTQLCKNMEKGLGKYSVNKDTRLQEFQKRLNPFKTGQRKMSVVKDESFEIVVQTLQERVQKKLADALKGDVPEDMFDPLISALLFLPADNLKKQGQKLSEKKWSHSDFQCFSEEFQQRKRDIMNSTETCRIVNDVVLCEEYRPSPKGALRGKMTIIRATSIPNGNRMYATLCLARTVASDCYSFEILRDYGNFKISDMQQDSGNLKEETALFRIRRILQRKQCQFIAPNTCEQCRCNVYSPSGLRLTCLTCGHCHTDINQFEDLDKLPCLLILVKKGRMGDTFPHSFNAMDLRLHFTKSEPYLSSLQQEVGRLCRYTPKNVKEDLPYVLVGKGLAKLSRDALNTTAVFRGLYVGRAKHDSHMRQKKPGANHFHHKNTEKRKNCILLQAEPQIGKTGVYLCFISMLCQLIIPYEEPLEVLVDNYDDENDSDTDASEGESNPKDEIAKTSDADLEDNWKFPYWKDVAGKPPVLKRETSRGKYSKIYGRYKYGRRPELLMRLSSNQPPQNEATHFEVSGYRAYKLAHNCRNCQIKANSVLQTSVKVADTPVDISLPMTCNYQPVLDTLGLKNRKPTEIQATQVAPPGSGRLGRSLLQSWIFTPTYGRAQQAYLNLHHTMVDPETRETCRYVHLLVVRSSQYGIYWRAWGQSHGIIRLPDSLPGCETSVEEGGVGYARRFIQLFAEEFNLKAIFMLDDNVLFMREVSFHGPKHKQVVKRHEANLCFGDEPVPFYTVLHRLETQMSPPKDCSVPKPKKEFEAHPQADPEIPLESYTGPSETYAVLGLLRHSRFIYKIKKGFKRTHVHCVVHLNVQALKQRGVCYKPWQVFEDLNLNNQCDDCGLLVVKYNRWACCKVSLPTWLPGVYIWTEETSLKQSLQTSGPPKPCSQLIAKWMCSLRPIVALETFPEKSKCHTDLAHLIEQLQCRLKKRKPESETAGCHALAMVFHWREELERLIQDVQNYLRTNSHVRGLDTHILVLEVEGCLATGMVTKDIIRSSVLQQFFLEGFSFDVITSCNPFEHKPDILLIRICGKVEGVSDYVESSISRDEMDEQPADDESGTEDLESLSTDVGSVNGAEGNAGDIPVCHGNDTMIVNPPESEGDGEFSDSLINQPEYPPSDMDTTDGEAADDESGTDDPQSFSTDVGAVTGAAVSAGECQDSHENNVVIIDSDSEPVLSELLLTQVKPQHPTMPKVITVDTSDSDSDSSESLLPQYLELKQSGQQDNGRSNSPIVISDDDDNGDDDADDSKCTSLPAVGTVTNEISHQRDDIPGIEKGLDSGNKGGVDPANDIECTALPFNDVEEPRIARPMVAKGPSSKRPFRLWKDIPRSKQNGSTRVQAPSQRTSSSGSGQGANLGRLSVPRNGVGDITETPGGDLKVPGSPSLTVDDTQSKETQKEGNKNVNQGKTQVPRSLRLSPSNIANPDVDEPKSKRRMVEPASTCNSPLQFQTDVLDSEKGQYSNLDLRPVIWNAVGQLTSPFKPIHAETTGGPWKLPMSTSLNSTTVDNASAKELTAALQDAYLRESSSAHSEATLSQYSEAQKEGNENVNQGKPQGYPVPRSGCPSPSDIANSDVEEPKSKRRMVDTTSVFNSTFQLFQTDSVGGHRNDQSQKQPTLGHLPATYNNPEKSQEENLGLLSVLETGEGNVTSAVDTICAGASTTVKPRISLSLRKRNRRFKIPSYNKSLPPSAEPQEVKDINAKEGEVPGYLSSVSHQLSTSQAVISLPLPTNEDDEPMEKDSPYFNCPELQKNVSERCREVYQMKDMPKLHLTLSHQSANYFNRDELERDPRSSTVLQAALGKETSDLQRASQPMVNVNPSRDQRGPFQEKVTRDPKEGFHGPPRESSVSPFSMSFSPAQQKPQEEPTQHNDQTFHGPPRESSVSPFSMSLSQTQQEPQEETTQYNDKNFHGPPRESSASPYDMSFSPTQQEPQEQTIQSHDKTNNTLVDALSHLSSRSPSLSPSEMSRNSDDDTSNGYQTDPEGDWSPFNVLSNVNQ